MPRQHSRDSYRCKNPGAATSTNLQDDTYARVNYRRGCFNHQETVVSMTTNRDADLIHLLVIRRNSATPLEARVLAKKSVPEITEIIIQVFQEMFMVYQCLVFTSFIIMYNISCLNLSYRT